MVKPRDYQTQALAARADAQANRPDENRQAIVMATGLGKGNVIAWEAAAEPGRTLVLGHTDEIVDQLRRRLDLLAPDRTVGTVKAGQNDVDAEIIVGSVQTLANPGRKDPLGQIDRVIVDECHHATASTYTNVLYHFGSVAGSTPTTGYTATLERGDGQSLGGVWQDVAFSRGISWAVRRGHLVPPVGYRVEVPGLTKSATDEVQDHVIVDGIAPEAVLQRWFGLASDRSTIVFAPLVTSARAFAQAFQAMNITAAVVYGEQDKAERRTIIAAYQRGDIQVLCNANALTEGFDAPRTGCVILPPTQSRVRVIQRAGRGLRPWLDGPIPRHEQDCILLFLGDGAQDLNSVADLSDHEGLTAEEGQSLTELEDQYNLNDLEPDAPSVYDGALSLVQFDPLVAASDKVWSRTTGGAMFVPAGRDNYAAILPGYAVAVVGRRGGGRVLHRDVPDMELAMALAEDAALDAGGDMGRLLADKTRPWRKGVPTADAQEYARAIGLSMDVDRIMASRASGKAGKLSDLVDRVTASKVIDPVVARINARTGQR